MVDTVSLLRVESLSKNFGGVQALDNASLSFEGKGITALVGPNGAGKTTLYNVISGFVAADHGKVIFDGKDITGHKAEHIAKNGLLRTFQNSSGFSSMSVWENLMVSAARMTMESPFFPLRGKKAAKLLQQPLSTKVCEMLEEVGMLHVRDRQLADLTMAELRIVEILRQLILQPRMLLLDEPAAGFGPDMLGQLEKLIYRIRDTGIPILIIEHNLPFVSELADYIFVLARGTVIKEGIPKEVFADEQVIKNYIGTGAVDA